MDAISFLALGKVFTAFMTGNIAFLGMGIAGNAEAPSIVAVLASMVGFAADIQLATRIVTPHRGEQATAVVWPQRTTVALAVSLVGHLCFVGTWFALGGGPSGGITFPLLPVWALAMEMQSTAFRHLNVGGVFTTPRPPPSTFFSATLRS